MVPNDSASKKWGWWLVMVGLFLVTVVVVNKRESLKGNAAIVISPVYQDQLKLDEARISREKKIEIDIESWREKLAELKSEIRSSRVFSTQRSYLKKLLRELKADERLVRKELRDLRLSSESEWEHLADHLEAELENMNESFENRKTQ